MCLSQTRAQAQKEKDEDATEAAKKEEVTGEIVERKKKGNSPKGKMMTWLEKTMNSFHLHGNAPNLLNTHQECKLTLTLPEKTYSKWMSKFFKLQSLFNSYCILAALHMTSRGMDYSTTEDKRKSQGILL